MDPLSVCPSWSVPMMMLLTTKFIPRRCDDGLGIRTSLSVAVERFVSLCVVGTGLGNTLTILFGIYLWLFACLFICRFD